MHEVVLFAGLAFAAVHDLRTYRIPNALVAIMSFAWLVDASISAGPNHIAERLLAAGLVVVGLALIRKIVQRPGRGSPLGGGDMKIVAVIVLYLGGRALLSLFMASVICLIFVVGKALLLRSLTPLASRVPFAPYILVGVVATKMMRHVFDGVLP